MYNMLQQGCARTVSHTNFPFLTARRVVVPMEYLIVLTVILIVVWKIFQQDKK